MRYAIFVILAVLASFLGGVLVGRTWTYEIDRQFRRTLQMTAQRFSDPPPQQRLEDSLSMARLTRNPIWPPREIRRMQAFGHRIVTYEIRDTTWRNLQLMNVRGQYERGTEMRRGWRYDEGGYDQGEIVSVVIPNLDCNLIRTIAFGAARVLTPEERVRAAEISPPPSPNDRSP